jgi:polyhydroxyalkanoate synthesis regulator protein
MTIIKYNNRKLYNVLTHSYINLKDLVSLPLGSFRVITKETGKDITNDTLFSYLGNLTDSVLETKNKVMKYLLSQ